MSQRQRSVAAVSEPERDIAVLWTDGDTQCVLSWSHGRYRVRLTSGGELVRDDFESDEATALAVSKRWRIDAGREAGPSRDRRH